MLIRRITEHLKSQNWTALWLDFIVVVVGVFLAFQVERWYDDQRRQAEEQGHLASLQEDFVATKIQLERVIATHQRSVDSATLLITDEAHPDGSLNHDRFYELLGQLQLTGTPNIVRRTYDQLIASGDIDVVQNRELKEEIASFYALAEGREDFQHAQLLNFEASVFIPYVNQYLDHVAMAKKLHAEDAESFQPPTVANQFETVLGTSQFEGMVTTKWHLSRDYKFTNEMLLDRLTGILELLDENLRQFE